MLLSCYLRQRWCHGGGRLNFVLEGGFYDFTKGAPFLLLQALHWSRSSLLMSWLSPLLGSYANILSPYVVKEVGHLDVDAELFVGVTGSSLKLTRR